MQRRTRFALLSLVVDETESSVVITDVDGLIEYVNPGFSRLTGYSMEEVLGRKPGKLVQGPHTDPDTIARIQANLRDGKPCYEEILNYTKSGEPYWISLSINPIRDPHGGVVRFVSVQANITETKQRVTDARARLDAIERSTVVVEWDPHGAMVSVNDLGLQLLRLTSDRIAGQFDERDQRPGHRHAEPDRSAAGRGVNCHPTGSSPHERGQRQLSPPSTGRQTPFMYRASSEARNSAACATSQAVPMRAVGLRAWRAATMAS